MKKHNYLLLCISVLCLSVSCSKDTLSDAPETPVSVTQTRATDPNLLSIEEVRSLALSLPREFSDSPATRAATGKAIKEIVPFSHFVKSSPLTRALVDGSDDADDNVLDNIYVVNYEGDAGFAIISADKRLRDVLGYSDSGNITDTMSNPGMRLFMEILPEYAASTLSGGFGDIYDTFPSWGGGGSFPPLPPLDSFPPLCDFKQDTTVVKDWDGDVTGPLIPVKWSQRAPFNDKADWCSAHNYRTPAGCVATAMMQIMVYHEWPQSLGEYGIINWGRLSKYKYAAYFLWDDYGLNLSDKTRDSLLVGNLFRKVGDMVHMDYDCDGSSSDIKNANAAFTAHKDPFNTLSYASDGISDYDETQVHRDLTFHNLPVYTRGESSAGGHAWVIDGIKLQRRTMRETTYWYLKGTNVLDHTTSRDFIQERHYVHCNWGWSGENNGWFYENVFQTMSPAEKDPNTGYTQNHNFKKIKIIKNLHAVQY